MIILSILFIFMPIAVICMEQPSSADTKESETARIELPEKSIEQKEPKRLLKLSKAACLRPEPLVTNENNNIQNQQFKFAEALAKILDTTYDTELSIIDQHLEANDFKQQELKKQYEKLRAYKDDLAANADKIMKRLNKYAQSDNIDVNSLTELKHTIKNWSVECPVDENSHKKTRKGIELILQKVIHEIYAVDPNHLESEGSSCDEEHALDDDIEL